MQDTVKQCITEIILMNKWGVLLIRAIIFMQYLHILEMQTHLHLGNLQLFKAGSIPPSSSLEYRGRVWEEPGNRSSSVQLYLWHMLGKAGSVQRLDCAAARILCQKWQKDNTRRGIRGCAIKTNYSICNILTSIIYISFSKKIYSA